MNEVLTGLVDTSDNLGELHMDGREFRMVFEIRSAQDSLKYYIYENPNVPSLVGAKCSTEVEYASWHFRANSPLRETAVEVYKKKYGSEPTVLTVHAGLEVGCFRGRAVSRRHLAGTRLLEFPFSFRDGKHSIRQKSIRIFVQYFRGTQIKNHKGEIQKGLYLMYEKGEQYGR